MLKSISKNFGGAILDFDAGNGELCRRISQYFKNEKIVCFEPSVSLRKQAVDNLIDHTNIIVEGEMTHYSDSYFDFIFCLELFEHLPDKKIHEELSEIQRLAKPKSTIIFGVPNEIFLAALVKGFIRLKRRHGEVDAKFWNIIKASFGFPPKQREVISFDNLPYIIRHMGFDHRKFKKQLRDHFLIKICYGSPNIYLPIFLNLEIYFICEPLLKLK